MKTRIYEGKDGLIDGEGIEENKRHSSAASLGVWGLAPMEK